MNLVYEAARELQEFCRAERWRFCFIGGIAVQRWGEPRLTQDVAVTLLTSFHDEPFVDLLLGRFSARIDDARNFAFKSRVLLLWSSKHIGMDVALGGLHFEEGCVARSSDFEVSPGVAITTCSAEDLIVMKAFAGRAKDWLDIEGIATRQSGKLDTALVFRELDPLLELKEDAKSRETVFAPFSRKAIPESASTNPRGEFSETSKTDVGGSGETNRNVPTDRVTISTPSSLSRSP